MSRSVRTTKWVALSVMAVLSVAACSSDPVQAPAEVSFQVQSVGTEDPIHVMTQNGVPSEVMNALFEGNVIADGAGCLRLDDAEGSTVVWPVQYTGEITSEGFAILDEDGTEVGQVGGSFSFGGGILPELLASLGFSQADRDLAEGLCPGSYWIVAP